ncbi:MAG: molybdopterin-guanine dinucleotide biosynthesis protein A [Planctomycetaceae bacterium]|nr:molybdopterin-guanine dinucleotide biosynthesis protein A [Planctomycetaceae bacterium]
MNLSEVVGTHPIEGVGGVVLCGGHSERMGRPKLSLPFGDELMLTRIVGLLSEVVSPVIVVAAQHQQLPALGDGVIVVRDERPDLGPLGGLAVGLAALQSQVQAAFVTGCDCPLLQTAFVRHMVLSLGAHDLAIPRDGKYHHPLAGVYRTSLVGQAQQLIAAGRMRPLFLIEAADALEIDVEELRECDPQLHSLLNMNTPEQYQQALDIAGFSAGDPAPHTIDEKGDPV